MEGDGRVAKQIGACGFFARVHVRCENVGQPTSSVSLDPSANDSWQRSEGWTDAAQVGAALGLKLAGRTAHCTITRIHGMPCDTNPTLVAIAAIRAVWAALAFTPDEALAERLEVAVLRRSELGVADLECELGRVGS